MNHTPLFTIFLPLFTISFPHILMSMQQLYFRGVWWKNHWPDYLPCVSFPSWALEIEQTTRASLFFSTSGPPHSMTLLLGFVCERTSFYRTCGFLYTNPSWLFKESDEESDQKSICISRGLLCIKGQEDMVDLTWRGFIIGWLLGQGRSEWHDAEAVTRPRYEDLIVGSCDSPL